MDGRQITIDLDQPFAQAQTLVSLEVTGSDTWTGPNWPPLKVIDEI